MHASRSNFCLNNKMLNTSTFLQIPPTLSPPTTQSSDQQQSAARVHSITTVQPSSTSNIFRSITSIHRSTSALPASHLDLDVASSAGLQVIRPDTHPEAFVPVPPDGGWGWIVVAAAFLTNLIIDGICVTFGIMVTDFVEHFNASVASVMLLGSLLVGMYQIIGPIAAGLVNRFGCRAVGIGASVLASVSMFASAFMPNIEWMIVSYGIFAGSAFGLLHLPSIICVSFYFDSRRALAVGITSVGTPVGAMIFAHLSELLLNKYGWANTLILFAGILLNCAVFAALYRPLTPDLILTPMNPEEAQAIKSLLQLAVSEEEHDRISGGISPSAVTSQRDLRDQPILEEVKEEDEGKEMDNVLQKPLTTIVEGPEETEGGTADSSKPKVDVEVIIRGPKHHRHRRQRKMQKTLRRHLHHQYALWLKGIRQVRSSRGENGHEEPGGENSDYSDSKSSDESSQASTCHSSCKEDASHWDSTSDATSETDEKAANIEEDAVKHSQKNTKEKYVTGGKKSFSGRSKFTTSADECIFSAPSLNQFSGTRKENKSLSTSPQAKFIHFANASVSRHRSLSIAACQLTQSQIGNFGSALFASTLSPGASGLDGTPSIEELSETAPVIVELPHESVTVEDYARPLYRKDIFFPGSIKRQIEPSSTLITTGVQNVPENPEDQVIASQISIDGVRRRKTTMGTSIFGSTIQFGDNVPFPDKGNSTDVNWTGSCLMSLTKIPIPDVFENDKEEENEEDYEAKIWDRLKAEGGLNLTEKRADGIYRVPRYFSLCGWWLCWQTQEKHSVSSGDEAERFKRTVVKGGESGDQLMKYPPKPNLVLIRRCVYLPKSLCDVLVTMINLSLLKSSSFAILCAGNAIAMLGVYVPLFFVYDLSESFAIPQSQSAYLMTVYGAVSAVSRLLSSWISAKPNVSSTILTAIALIICGISACVMPFWGNLTGQILVMVVFGLTISPFFSLASVIICDILGLEALTNGYGIVTMVRGIASTAGSPLAGMIASATNSYAAALVTAGSTIVIGGVLYTLVVLLERRKLRRMLAVEVGSVGGRI
nr:monocarboxylate transporter [Hymenolepis microstoma]